MRLLFAMSDHEEPSTLSSCIYSEYQYSAIGGCLYEKAVCIFGVKIGRGCAYGSCQLYLILNNFRVRKPLC
jgi:hypothetical protein